MKKILIGLGILCIPSLLYSQKENQIAIQVGLFHSYLDNSPLLNRNLEGEKVLKFRHFFHDSWNINYSRTVNDKSRIGVGVEYLNSFYHQNNYFVPKPVIGNRNWMTFQLNYLRNLRLNDKFSFDYGIGLNYRHGIEAINIARIQFGSPGLELYELLTEVIFRRDVGINFSGSVHYDLNESFFIYSKLDFLGIFYIHDKDAAQEMREVYNAPQFPSRYDLSLNFGIGINF